MGPSVCTLVKPRGSDDEHAVREKQRVPNSEQELLKAELTVQIFKLVSERKLTQSNATELLGTTQAQVSALMRCRPVSISIGRLMDFLTILGQDVEP